MVCIFYFARCMNVLFNSLLAQLVRYDVYTTSKIKSIHAIFITYYYCTAPPTVNPMAHFIVSGKCMPHASSTRMSSGDAWMLSTNNGAMCILLSSWRSHCECWPDSSGECRAAPSSSSWPSNHGFGCELVSLPIGCYRILPPSLISR